MLAAATSVAGAQPLVHVGVVVAERDIAVVAVVIVGLVLVCWTRCFFARGGWSWYVFPCHHPLHGAPHPTVAAAVVVVVSVLVVVAATVRRPLCREHEDCPCRCRTHCCCWVEWSQPVGVPL